MKKFFALCLSVIMLFVCTISPVSAIEVQDAELPAEQHGKVLAYFDVVPDEESGYSYLVWRNTPDAQDESMVQPRNRDWGNRLSGVQTTSKFRTDKTYNLKLHMYLNSNTPEGVTVRFQRGGSAGMNSQFIVRWEGEGHQYTDLLLNAPAGEYGVALFGWFSGSGSVYSEP